MRTMSITEDRLLIIANRIATRQKGLLKDLKNRYENVPDYVLKEVYNGSKDKMGRLPQFESMLKEFNQRKWKLETIDLSWSNLNGITKNNMRRRKLGLLNPDGVPEDAERLERQVKTQSGTGKNEPMIFLQTQGGLELIEGFHRTMAILLNSSGDAEKAIEELSKVEENGVDKIVSKWKSAKAKAWVGYEDPDKKEEEEEEPDFGF